MTDQELVELAFAAVKQAYAPYSRFQVGAALLCADGTVYTGCNVENAAYGACICAERVALVKAVSGGKQKFLRLAVAAESADYCTPCGICRQMLFEFGAELEVLCARSDRQFLRATLGELLPHGFGPQNLDGTKQI